MTRTKNRTAFSRRTAPAGDTAVLVPMMNAGTWVTPFWQALTEAGLTHYRQVFVPACSDLFSLGPAAVTRVRAPEVEPGCTLRALPYTLADIRSEGAPLCEWLNEHTAHVFVSGNACAMHVAARFDVWRRESKSPTRWIGLPCCPYNSVPFSDYNVGFPSALRQCTEFVEAAGHARHRERGFAPVAVVEVEGDTNGWLGAGSAALAHGPFVALYTMPSGANQFERLYAEVDRAVKADRAVVIMCGDAVRDAAHRPIAPVDAPAGPALAARVARHSGVDVVALRINPGAAGDTLRAARCERRAGRALARAAVRAARKAVKGLLVTARRGLNAEYTLTYSATALTEAVNTPRAVGDRFLRPRQCKPAAALAEYLRPLVE